MNRTQSPDPFGRWHWSEDAVPAVAFCVRSLVVDGLAIAPFDRHADGNRSLRGLGLDADRWRRWLAAVIEAHAAISALVRSWDPTHHPPGSDEARGLAEALRAPGSMCPGSGALEAELNARFRDYEPEAEAWRRRMPDIRRRLGPVRQQRALWNALTPFHERLAPLEVLLVEYPVPVVMPLPPATCLISPDDDPAGYARQIVRAATELAEA